MAVSYFKRFVRLTLGLFLYSLGTYTSVQANVGLTPWDAFAMGITNLIGISFGTAVIYLGAVILVVDFLLHEKIGAGTVMNTLLIGAFVNMIEGWGIIPQMQRFLPGVLLLLLGQFVLCVGSVFYISAALGCGPRDALMVGLGKRLSKLPVGAVRALLEGSALLVGFLLGAKVGVGTVIAVFGIGFILEWTFRLFRFDVKAVRHESMLDTLRIWQGKAAPQAGAEEAPALQAAGGEAPAQEPGE